MPLCYIVGTERYRRTAGSPPLEVIRMTNSFSEELRQEALPIWDSIFAHPFLEEIEAATLPLEKFRYYVEQDYHYLAGFGQVVATALSKAPDTHTLRRLTRRITTPVERPLHGKMFELLEMSEDEVESVALSPTNSAYINHMQVAASTGGVGEAAAALLPCPWTYHEIGMRIAIPEHPVYSYWAEPYREGLLEESTAAWRELVDEFAANGGPAVREAMRDAFITSSRYEFMFWSMAYNMESWPV